MIHSSSFPSSEESDDNRPLGGGWRMWWSCVLPADEGHGQSDNLDLHLDQYLEDVVSFCHLSRLTLVSTDDFRFDSFLC